MAEALQPVRILGVPMDLGQRRRGVDMGPSAIRYAALKRRLERIGYNVTDGGNVAVPVVEEIETETDDRAHNAETIGLVCRDIYVEMRNAIARDEFAVFLGGDHSMAMGTGAGALTRGENVGVLWIDAHGDFNTPQTTPSGNVHGMVVASLMGLCPPELTIGEARLLPDRVVYIGVRDLDPEEKRALSAHNIKVLTMRDIDERGIAWIVRHALDTLGDMDTLHVSLDLDSLDPAIAPGVGTPVPGGLTYREAHLIMETLADDGRARSLDLVEVNPILDVSNATAKLAVELTASLLGQRIL